MSCLIVINNAHPHFTDSMQVFANKLFDGDYDKANEFYANFCLNIMDESKFPANKMVLNPFCGNNNEFCIAFQYNGKEICRCVFAKSRYGIIEIKSANYKIAELKEMFHGIIEAYIQFYNNDLLYIQMTACGLSTKKEDNAVWVEKYNDYELDTTTQFVGTIDKIFSEFTSANETYKYCNGTYFKFKDKEIEKLYAMYVANYNSNGGNYSLMNAVKDGRLID